MLQSPKLSFYRLFRSSVILSPYQSSSILTSSHVLRRNTVKFSSSSSSSTSAPRSPFRQLLNNKNLVKDEKHPSTSSPSAETNPSATTTTPGTTKPSEGPKSPFRDPNASIFGDKIKNSFQRASEHQRQVYQKSNVPPARNEGRNASENVTNQSRGGDPRSANRRQSNQRAPNQQSRPQADSRNFKHQSQQRPKVDPAQLAIEDEGDENDPETVAAERTHLASARSGQARHEQKMVHLEHKRKEV